MKITLILLPLSLLCFSTATFGQENTKCEELEKAIISNQYFSYLNEYLKCEAVCEREAMTICNDCIGKPLDCVGQHGGPEEKVAQENCGNPSNPDYSVRTNYRIKMAASCDATKSERSDRQVAESNGPLAGKCVSEKEALGKKSGIKFLYDKYLSSDCTPNKFMPALRD